MKEIVIITHTKKHNQNNLNFIGRKLKITKKKHDLHTNFKRTTPATIIIYNAIHINQIHVRSE